MNFDEWWESVGKDTYRLTPREVWDAAVEECVKVCEEMKDPWAPLSYDLACSNCVIVIRTLASKGRNEE